MSDQSIFESTSPNEGGSLPPGMTAARNAGVSVTAGTYDGTFAEGKFVLTPVDPNQPHADDANCWCGPTVENFG